MWKNILYFLFGALIFSALIDRPIFAQSQNFSYLNVSTSNGELTLFDPNNGTIYYYSKDSGKVKRIHRLKRLGKQLEIKKVKN